MWTGYVGYILGVMFRRFFFFGRFALCGASLLTTARGAEGFCFAWRALSSRCAAMYRRRPGESLRFALPGETCVLSLCLLAFVFAAGFFALRFTLAFYARGRLLSTGFGRFREANIYVRSPLTQPLPAHCGASVCPQLLLLAMAGSGDCARFQGDSLASCPAGPPASAPKKTQNKIHRAGRCVETSQTQRAAVR